MADIQSRADVENLINTFYRRVLKDTKIGFIFTDVAPIDWSTHLPLICDFWETVLLGNMKYRGNPMLKHLALDDRISLTPAHFNQWLRLWEQTTRQLFTGPIADEAIKRAQLMGQLMQHKIALKNTDKGFIQ